MIARHLPSSFWFFGRVGQDVPDLHVRGDLRVHVRQLFLAEREKRAPAALDRDVPQQIFALEGDAGDAGDADHVDA